MPSSGEIAQMFASQQAAFASQNVFATQIGVATPGMGLGGYGFGGSVAGRFQQGPGGAPPVWSYAPTGLTGAGYGAGNQFAGNAMAGFGGLATAGGVGLGLMAGFGKLGALGHAIDPFGAAFKGFQMAGGMSGGVGAFGAGALAAMPAIGIGMAASHMVGSFVHGGQQQAGINREMGQFNFFNPQSRTGSGFTRDDAQMIGSRIRELAHIPEMMTSVEELTRLLPNLRKAGTFQGIKEIGEFQTRFNDSIKTIKTMSKMLGTTMEQASEFFAHSTSVGFLGKQAQLQNVLNAQFTSGVTGMSMGQVMGMQQQGAQMGVQLGVGRKMGADAITKNTQRLGALQMSGVIGEGELEDITGLEGPAAVQAAGTRMTQAAINMTQNSAPGHLLMMGLAKFDSSGRAIGLDEELVARLKANNLSVGELKRRVSSLTETQKLSVKNRAPSLSVLTAGNAGPEALGSIYKELMEDRFGRGAKADEAMGMLMQRSGLSEREADVFKKGIGQSASGMEDMARIKQREALIAEKYSPAAYWQKFKVSMRNVTTAPFEEAGAYVFNALGKEFDKFFDDIVGRHMVTLSKEGAESFAKALAGNTQEFRKEMSRLHGTSGDMKRIARQEKWTAGSFVKGFMDVASLGTTRLFGADWKGDFDLGLKLMNEDDSEPNKLARKQALEHRALGGGFSGVRAGYGSSGKAGFMADAVEEWQRTQSYEDSRDTTKVAVGLSSHFHKQIVDDLSKHLLDPSNKSLLEGAVSRGDMQRVTELTGKTEAQLMAAGGVATKGAMMARAGGGEGSLGSLAAGKAMNAAGISLTGLAKKYDVTSGPAGQFYTEQEISANRDKANAALASGINGGDVLSKSSAARRAAAAVLGDEYDENGKANGSKSAAGFVSDVSRASPSTIVGLMKAKGITINETEAEAVKKAAQMSLMEDSEGNRAHKDRAWGLVAAARNMDIEGDISVIKKRAGEVYGNFSETLKNADGEFKSAEGFGEALRGVSNSQSRDEYNSKLGGVREALKASIEEGAAIYRSKDDKKYKKFLAAHGQFSQSIDDAVKSETGLEGKNNISFDKLAESMGIKSDADKAALRKSLNENADFVGIADLGAFNFQGEDGKKKLRSINESVAGMRAANQIAPSGATTNSLDTEREILSTLREMQTVAKLQTTMLIAGRKDDPNKSAADTYLSNIVFDPKTGQVTFKQ